MAFKVAHDGSIVEAVTYDQADQNHCHFVCGNVQVRSRLRIHDLKDAASIHPFAFPPPWNTVLLPLDALFVGSDRTVDVPHEMQALSEVALRACNAELAHDGPTVETLTVVDDADDVSADEMSEEETWSEYDDDAHEETHDIDATELDALEDESGDGDGEEDVEGGESACRDDTLARSHRSAAAAPSAFESAAAAATAKGCKRA
jgi:hypothetical protein